MKNKTEIPAAEAAHAAKQASFALAAAPGKARSSALLAVAAALHAKANMVFKANEIDMRQAEKEGLAAPALKRLKFDAHKLEDVCAGLEQLGGSNRAGAAANRAGRRSGALARQLPHRRDRRDL